MKIIDAHMHFFRCASFDEDARAAGHENTVENYLKSCKENNVVMSVARGMHQSGRRFFWGCDSPGTGSGRGIFSLTEYNQPKEIAYCAGVESEALNDGNCQQTALEFEQLLKTPQCVGIKIYTGYCQVYAYDPVHFPLYELAEAYDVPVVFHTGGYGRGPWDAEICPSSDHRRGGQSVPRVKFVIAHCGNPWILDAMEVVAKNPQCVCGSVGPSGRQVRRGPVL